MTFNEFLDLIATDQDPLYYDHLLEYSDQILALPNSSKDIANMLRLNAQQYAMTKRLLQAYRRQHNDYAR